MSMVSIFCLKRSIASAGTGIRVGHATKMLVLGMQYIVSREIGTSTTHWRSCSDWDGDVEMLVAMLGSFLGAMSVISVGPNALVDSFSSNLRTKDGPRRASVVCRSSKDSLSVASPKRTAEMPAMIPDLCPRLLGLSSVAIGLSLTLCWDAGARPKLFRREVREMGHEDATAAMTLASFSVVAEGCPATLGWRRSLRISEMKHLAWGANIEKNRYRTSLGGLAAAIEMKTPADSCVT